MATTGSLLASNVPSRVAGKVPTVGTKASFHVVPPSAETVYLVVLVGRGWPVLAIEKSLMAATRVLVSPGTTAMCSSDSGLVVVVVTVGPTLTASFGTNF